MRFNVLIGGEAGQGPNILAYILGRALVRKGLYVFCSRDYPSLIKGGHNFNVLTFSNETVNSNDSKMDILIALDERTYELHKKDLNENAEIINGERGNMYFAGKLFKLLGIEFELLEEELKILQKRYEENLKEAKKGYEESKQKFELEIGDWYVMEKEIRFFRNGSMGIADGAINAGIDIYYAYPMTPATAVMGELAEKQIEKNYIVIELENEIAVANAGIGSAITGAKTMVGTSGGGFDLMSEALSLTGIAGVPLVFYLAQRPGPATGVATYQAQGDLNLARHTGHGEFPRVVLAPGDPKEAEELTTEAFYFSQKFKIPSIIIGDKHLADSFYTTEGKPDLTISDKSTSLGRYNSYEKSEGGSMTEKPETIIKNVDNRKRKALDIEEEADEFEQYKIYGNVHSNNVILAWGSTKGAILDAIKFEGIDAKFIQILYLNPFPSEDLWREMMGKNLILIENNSTGQLGELLKEKTGFNIPPKNRILRYDGRPFLRDELVTEIKKRIKK